MTSLVFGSFSVAIPVHRWLTRRLNLPIRMYAVTEAGHAEKHSSVALVELEQRGDQHVRIIVGNVAALFTR